MIIRFFKSSFNYQNVFQSFKKTCENRANQHGSRFFIVYLEDDTSVSTPQGSKSGCEANPGDQSQEAVEETKFDTDDSRTTLQR